MTCCRTPPSRTSKVIVVTDGERILGLRGSGASAAWAFPVGKLSLYRLRRHLSRLLPAGGAGRGHQQPATAERPLLAWRLAPPRASPGGVRRGFVDAFIQAVKRRWPDILLQFEDFARGNATCCSTATRTSCAASTMTSRAPPRRDPRQPHRRRLQASRPPALSEKRVAFSVPAAPGCGIASRIVAQMKAEGLTDARRGAGSSWVDR